MGQVDELEEARKEGGGGGGSDKILNGRKNLMLTLGV